MQAVFVLLPLVFVVALAVQHFAIIGEEEVKELGAHLEWFFRRVAHLDAKRGKPNNNAKCDFEISFRR